MPTGLIDIITGTVLTAMFAAIGFLSRAAFLRIEHELRQVNITLDTVPSALAEIRVDVATLKQWRDDHERGHWLRR